MLMLALNMFYNFRAFQMKRFFNTLIFCFILHLARIVGHQARAIALRLLA